MSPCPSSEQLRRLLAEELNDAERDPLDIAQRIAALKKLAEERKDRRRTLDALPPWSANSLPTPDPPADAY
jgi:hypothetical protein